MTDRRIKAARRFAQEARRRHPDQVERVLLFGSLARGEEHQESDTDVHVVWRGEHNEGLRIMTGLAFHLLLKTEEYVSVKILTPEGISEGKARGNLFVEAVLAEGRALA